MTEQAPNLLGCAAYLSDVMLTPDDVAVLQGLVLLIAIGLVLLARNATARRWIT